MIDEREAGRLRALDRYHVLESAPEEAFDRLTALAADLLAVSEQNGCGAALTFLA
jgi:hypothetical protein